MKERKRNMTTMTSGVADRSLKKYDSNNAVNIYIFSNIKKPFAKFLFHIILLYILTQLYFLLDNHLCPSVNIRLDAILDVAQMSVQAL